MAKKKKQCKPKEPVVVAQGGHIDLPCPQGYVRGLKAGAFVPANYGILVHGCTGLVVE